MELSSAPSMPTNFSFMFAAPVVMQIEPEGMPALRANITF
jgi:hypothetical protein